MKAVAQLSGKLLARKGEALPAGRHYDTHNEFAHPPRPAPSFGRRRPEGEEEEMRRGEGTQAPHGNREMPTAESRKRVEKRYAFTLRLDPERHRRLRLLAAKTDRSAQSLMIEALDALSKRYGRMGLDCECLHTSTDCGSRRPKRSAADDSTEQGQ